ncbi:MAG: NAD-dependent DNA ligase LigA, partial [Clostridia bacterium]|nr:NAD-dependent DNA ligase LigA [Clostridia bacterium]
FKTLDKARDATALDLLAINDFGDISANAITEYFADEANIKLVDNLISKGFVFAEKPERLGVFSGMTVVLTGSLEGYKRSAAFKEIEERGGEVADSISSRVNLVIAGSDAGSKLAKANKLNIKIIDEAAFSEMLKD